MISDVEPVLECGRRPTKAVVGETFEVSATVIREGHELPGAGVVLRGPAGERLPLARMREVLPGTDRYAAEVTPSAEGRWRFYVEAWGDPIGHWRHDAGIKVPRGQDVERREEAAGVPAALPHALVRGAAAGRAPPAGRDVPCPDYAAIRAGRSTWAWLGGPRGRRVASRE